MSILTSFLSGADNVVLLRKTPSLAYLALATFVLLAVSCSKSTEAVTREQQEEMFADLVGFTPPKAVSEIKYKDIYNRGVMDGGWGRWMRFTYNDEVFARILKNQGFKQGEKRGSVDLKSEAAPPWWQDVDQSKINIYLRSNKDTQEDEGYSFEEYIWHDTNSNFVYFHKIYWD